MRKNYLMLTGLFITGLSLAACGDAEKNPANDSNSNQQSHHQTDDGFPPCPSNKQCGSGMICLTSEKHPEGVCVTECAKNQWGKNCENKCDCGRDGECSQGRNGDGSCQCYIGFSGDKCQNCDTDHFGQYCDGKCPQCSQHGKCQDGKDGDGLCHCDSGWKGNLCQIESEDTDDDCTVTGSCTSCPEDYYSGYCKPCPQCGAHGKCDAGVNGSGRCICTGDWTGPTCQNTPTPEPPPELSECQKAHNCQTCGANQYSMSCFPIEGGHDKDKICDGHGTAHSGPLGDGNCTCDKGYYGVSGEYCDDECKGNACKYPECKEDVYACNYCPAGEYSSNCLTCPNCKHGRCDDGVLGRGSCICEDGWYGSRCDTQVKKPLISFGHFEQDNDYTNGQEPITWRVVTTNGNKKLLVAEKILYAMNYYNQKDYDGFLPWSKSSVRGWLNGYKNYNDLNEDWSKDNFLNRAFTAEEQAKILTTDVSTAAQKITYIDENNNTQIAEIPADPASDKVFLLDEIEISAYIANGSTDKHDNESRVAYKSLYVNTSILGWTYIPEGDMNSNGLAEDWWIKGTSNGNAILAVGSFGMLDDKKMWVDINNIYSRLSLGGVRPAMWVEDLN